MKKRIYQWIFFRIMGWKITGAFTPEIRKSVIMVMPHTSWHDFYIGLLARGIIGLEMHWVGKSELFRFPWNIYFRWMGGEPLDRSGGLNKVDSIASVFARKQVFRLAIAPEGTRKKTPAIRTGFYYIALKANVPIIPVAFDFREKAVKIGTPLQPTGNFENDFDILMQHYQRVTGKIPNNAYDPKLFGALDS